MTNIIMLTILILFQGVLTIIDYKEMKRLIALEITREIRLKYYRETIVVGWIPLLIVSVFLFGTTIEMSDIGLRAVNMNMGKVWNIITCIIIAVAFVFFVYQIVMYVISDTYRVQVLNELNKRKDAGNYSERVIMRVMVPRSLIEKKYFFFVSLTAGVCEEIVWRGSIIYLLSSIFPGLSVLVAVLISSLLFGALHFYQGISGVIKTCLVGILFAILYVITDSLIIGMILHFLLDFTSAFLLDDKVHFEGDEINNASV